MASLPAVLLSHREAAESIFVMQEAICPYCKADPFEYATVDSEKIPVAITCCESAITDYYQRLTGIKINPNQSMPLLRSDNDG